MILRAKSGISKIAELQLYFSAELRVATTNCLKVPESAGDHGVFCISDCSAKAKLEIETNFGGPTIPWKHLYLAEVRVFIMEVYGENN